LAMEAAREWQWRAGVERRKKTTRVSLRGPSWAVS
jgi:hypothetical protein